MQRACQISFDTSAISTEPRLCSAHADPEVTDKVYFDLTVGGKPAGLTPPPVCPVCMCGNDVPTVACLC